MYIFFKIFWSTDNFLSENVWPHKCKYMIYQKYQKLWIWNSFIMIHIQKYLTFTHNWNLQFMEPSSPGLGVVGFRLFEPKIWLQWLIIVHYHLDIYPIWIELCVKHGDDIDIFFFYVGCWNKKGFSIPFNFKKKNETNYQYCMAVPVLHHSQKRSQFAANRGSLNLQKGNNNKLTLMGFI